MAAQRDWGRQCHPEHRAVPPPPRCPPRRGRQDIPNGHQRSPSSISPAPVPARPQSPQTPGWEVPWPVRPPHCPPGALRSWCHSGSSLWAVPRSQSAKGASGRWPLSGAVSTRGSRPLPATASPPCRGTNPAQGSARAQGNPEPLHGARPQHTLYLLPLKPTTN